MANILRIKRRASGNVGSPASLQNAELAFNEVDNTLYYGKGTGGQGGTATTVEAIAGKGAFVTLTDTQDISGDKTFTGTIIAPTQLSTDDSTKVATTGYVKSQNYLTGNETLTVSGDATGSGSTAIALTLASVGTAGTYTKVTTDVKGRVTAGAALAAGDIPALSASKISDFNAAVQTNRLDQMAAPNAALIANITGTAGNVTGVVGIVNGGTNATTTAQALSNLGAYAATNPLGFTDNTGTVTSVAVAAGSGVSVTGSPITGSGTITVTNTSPNATHTGDVTGAAALTIANNAVTNAKAADMAVNTIKGRISANTGDPEDLTATQVRTILNVADGAQVNVGTNLGTAAVSTNSRSITSSTGSDITVPAATTTVAGFMSHTDKSKLDGIAAGAQVNVATNLGQGGTGNSRTITSSTGTNVTVSTATTTNAGFMSTSDKSKLDGIADNANNFVHPTDGANSTISNANGLVLSSITVNTLGHVTAVGSKTLAAADVPNLDASKITTGIIDADRLPSFVDDVLEFADEASFPDPGETGKLYVAKDTNKVYRWSGTVYIVITSGAVDSVAGKTGVVTLVKADVGLSNVDNTADSVKNVSSADTVTSIGNLTGVVTSLNRATSIADGALSIAKTSGLQTALDSKVPTTRTVNGQALSSNITVTANTTNALTIGTGLSGSSFNGSGAVTIAIDSTVVTLNGVQTLTNKTIDGGTF